MENDKQNNKETSRWHSICNQNSQHRQEQRRPNGDGGGGEDRRRDESSAAGTIPSFARPPGAGKSTLMEAWGCTCERKQIQPFNLQSSVWIHPRLYQVGVASRTRRRAWRDCQDKNRHMADHHEIWESWGIAGRQ